MLILNAPDPPEPPDAHIVCRVSPAIDKTRQPRPPRATSIDISYCQNSFKTPYASFCKVSNLDTPLLQYVPVSMSHAIDNTQQHRTTRIASIKHWCSQNSFLPLYASFGWISTLDIKLLRDAPGWESLVFCYYSFFDGA